MRFRAWLGAGLGLALVGGALATAPVGATSMPSFTRTAALDIAGVEVPDGVGLIVHSDYPADAPLVVDGVAYHSVTLDVTPGGTVVTRNAIATEGESSSATNKCEDPAFKPLGVRWRAGAIPIRWRLDRRSIPDYLAIEKTKQSIRGAHRVWPRSLTTCSDEDKNTIRYNYIGHTGKNPKYDKTNIIDFGGLPGGALAQNYTWYRGTEIVEVDLRLNSSFPWTNVEGVNRYQVKNVTVHELGHQVGLDDLGDPHGELTMYALIDRGETNKTSLGWGDLKGAWAVSP